MIPDTDKATLNRFPVETTHERVGSRYVYIGEFIFPPTVMEMRNDFM